jgi:hypothetical protein
MSALPPKADIVQHGGNVRFVPKCDIAAPSLRQRICLVVIAEPPAERADFRKKSKAAVVPSAGIRFGKKSRPVS